MHNRPLLLNRLRWIAVSYLTRPLFLTLVGIGVALLGMGLLTKEVQYSSAAAYPTLPGAGGWSNTELEDWRAKGRQGEVYSLDLPRLWFEVCWDPRWGKPVNRDEPGPAPQEFYKILDDFPNLERIEFTCDSRRTGLNKVVEQTKLEFLKLHCRGNAPFDMSRLEPLKNLRELEVHANILPKNWHKLAILPKLKEVYIHGPIAGDIDERILTELTQLPRLTTLVMNVWWLYHSPPPRHSFDFSALSGAPSLETLYFGVSYEYDEKLVAETQRALPYVKVLSAHEKPKNDRRTSVLFDLLPFLLWATALGVQLSSQFRGANSRLTRDFGSSHAWVGASLGVVIALSAAWRLNAVGDLAWPAIIVSVTLVSTTVATMTTSCLVSLRLKRGGWLKLLGPGMLLILAIALADRRFREGVLLTYEPGILVGMLLTTVTAIVFSVWSLHKLVEWSGDLSRGNAARATWSRTQARRSWMFAIARQERRIESLASAAAERGWWLRVQRWRVGNPPFRYLLMGLLVCVFTLLMQALVKQFLVNLSWSMRYSLRLFTLDSSWEPMELSALLGGYLFTVAIQIGVMWRERLAILSWEQLHPCSLRTLLRDLLAAFVVDLLPLIVLFAVIEAIGLNFDRHWQLDWQAVPGSFGLFLLTGALWFFVSGGIVIMVRRLWLAMVLLSSILLFLLIGMMSLNDARVFDRAYRWAEVIQAQLWLPMVTGVILSAILARRWLNRGIAV